jgi:DNA polymerase-4
VQLKLRFADFRTMTRAETLPVPTSVTQEIAQAALRLLDAALPGGRPAIRLLGVGLSHFESQRHEQPMLFRDPDTEKHQQLDAAVDALHARFGAAALRRGSGLLHQAQHRPAPRPKGSPVE